MATDHSLKTVGFSPAFRMILAVACVVIIGAGLRAAAPILNPIFLGVLIALMGTPAMRRLERIGIPSWLALVLVAGAVVGIGLLLLLFMGLSLAELGDNLPQYEERLTELRTQATGVLGSWGLDVSTLLDNSLVQPERFLQVTAGVVSGLASALADGFLMLVFAAFMLMESESFTSKFRRVSQDNSRRVQQMEKFTGSVRHYMGIRVVAGGAAALLNLVLLLLLGVDFAVLWAILSFIMSFIPSVGFLIALIPPLLLALLNHGVLTAIFVAAGYIVVNGAIDTFLAPRFMGEGLNMSPLVIIISLTVWSWLLGPTGAILAVPLTMMLQQVVLEGYENTRWMGVLLGSGQDDSEESGSTDE